MAHIVVRPNGKRRDARQVAPQHRYSDLAIDAGPTMYVLIDRTGLDVYGAGNWLEDKHGDRSRRSWRKLYLALDADGGEIIGHPLTDQNTGDAS